MLSSLLLAGLMAAGSAQHGEVCRIVTAALLETAKASQFYDISRASVVEYAAQPFSHSVPSLRWEEYRRTLDADFPPELQDDGARIDPDCSIKPGGREVIVTVHRPLVNVRSGQAFVMFESSLGATEHLPGVVSRTYFSPVFCRLQKKRRAWTVTTCQKQF